MNSRERKDGRASKEKRVRERDCHGCHGNVNLIPRLEVAKRTTSYRYDFSLSHTHETNSLLGLMLLCWWPTLLKVLDADVLSLYTRSYIKTSWIKTLFNSFQGHELNDNQNTCKIPIRPSNCIYSSTLFIFFLFLFDARHFPLPTDLCIKPKQTRAPVFSSGTKNHLFPVEANIKRRKMRNNRHQRQRRKKEKSKWDVMSGAERPVEQTEADGDVTFLPLNEYFCPLNWLRWAPRHKDGPVGRTYYNSIWCNMKGQLKWGFI